MEVTTLEALISNNTRINENTGDAYSYVHETMDALSGKLSDARKEIKEQITAQTQIQQKVEQQLKTAEKI